MCECDTKILSFVNLAETSLAIPAHLHDTGRQRRGNRAAFWARASGLDDPPEPFQVQSSTPQEQYKASHTWEIIVAVIKF